MMGNKTHNTRNLLIAITVAIFGILGGLVWADYRDKKQKEELDQLLLERAKAYEEEDSIIVADSTVKENSLTTTSQEIKGTSSSSSSSSSSHSEDEEDEDTRKHPGTPPDDGMFGFDYYDDEDDAYEMDRNQSDAYPDDW